MAFCDCLDGIADAANKQIPGSPSQCPEHAQANFWTSSGGHYRVATISELMDNYSSGLNLANDLVSGDLVWSCNRATGFSNDYGVHTMGVNGTSSTGAGQVYCGYTQYNQRYTVCVDIDLSESDDCGSRCGL